MGLKPVTTPDADVASIELSMDGTSITAKDGVSLYDVAAVYQAADGFDLSPACSFRQ